MNSPGFPFNNPIQLKRRLSALWRRSRLLQFPGRFIHTITEYIAFQNFHTFFIFSMKGKVLHGWFCTFQSLAQLRNDYWLFAFPRRLRRLLQSAEWSGKEETFQQNANRNTGPWDFVIIKDHAKNDIGLVYRRGKKISPNLAPDSTFGFGLYNLLTRTAVKCE